jgi:aminoglycoside 6'-N-acetyltransferase
MSDYGFRPFHSADLPLVERWLKTPEVIEWWGDPKRELALLVQDLDEPLMRQWIVEYRGRAFAYAQAYPVGAWPQVHLKHLCPEAQMIDAFVGQPDMIGQGHGSAFLRQLARMLIAQGRRRSQLTLTLEINEPAALLPEQVSKETISSAPWTER